MNSTGMAKGGVRFAPGRIAGVISKRALSHLGDGTTCIAEYSVGMSREAGRASLHIACRLRSHRPESAGTLVFDLSPVPFRLTGWSSSIPGVSAIPRRLPEQPQFLAFQNSRASRTDEGGVVLEFKFAVPSERPASMDLLVFPEMCPRLLGGQGDACVEQPLLKVQHLLPAWNASPAVYTHGRHDSEALQLLLTKRDAFQPGQGDVLISSCFARGLTDGERARVRGLTTRLRDFYGELFARPVEGNIVVAHPSQAVSPAPLFPGCLFANAEQFGLGRQAGFPADALLARQAIGLWWGAGCRVVGRYARELEYSFASAASLLWQVHVGSEDLAAARIARYARALRELRPPDLLYSLAGEMRPTLTYQLVVSIFRSLRRDDRLLGCVRRLLHESWGEYVPSRRIIRDFAASGVELPASVRKCER